MPSCDVWTPWPHTFLHFPQGSPLEPALLTLSGSACTLLWEHCRGVLRAADTRRGAPGGGEEADKGEEEAGGEDGGEERRVGG